MRGLGLVAAFILDLVVGEPRRAHPVQAMGRYLDAAVGLRHRRGRVTDRDAVWGAGAVLFGALLAAGGASALTRGFRRLAPAASWLTDALLFKPTFSARELVAAGRRVGDALARGDLDGARRRAGRDLVGRETPDLSKEEVVSAVVESLAENLSDSVVAPLFWATAGGIPAAYAYRFLNTADAMIGYRTPEFEAYGRFAARADDLANLLPARLAAGFIAVSAPLAGGSTAGALKVAIRDARRTESPNAGWPMAAMAGALGVRLQKRGHHRLNGAAPWPGLDAVARAETIVIGATLLALGTAVVASRGGRLR